MAVPVYQSKLPKSPDGNFKASNDLATEIPAHCGDHPTSKKGGMNEHGFSSWKLDVFSLDGRCIKEFMGIFNLPHNLVNFISSVIKHAKESYTSHWPSGHISCKTECIFQPSYSLHSNTLSSGVLPLVFSFWTSLYSLLQIVFPNNYIVNPLHTNKFCSESVFISSICS